MTNDVKMAIMGEISSYVQTKGKLTSKQSLSKLLGQLLEKHGLSASSCSIGLSWDRVEEQETYSLHWKWSS